MMLQINTIRGQNAMGEVQHYSNTQGKALHFGAQRFRRVCGVVSALFRLLGPRTGWFTAVSALLRSLGLLF
jgi:hypothetical protein